MQSVRIQVIRSRSVRASDGFAIYADNGSGTIDWSRPVTSRRMLLWPESPRIAGHLWDGHLANVHLDGIRPDGLHEGVHLLDEHLRPAAAVAYDTRPYCFGRFQHAVVLVDAHGNANLGGAVVHENVINSTPAAPRELVPIAHDDMTDRLTFSFIPSEKLVG